jgi:hypothetical protein
LQDGACEFVGDFNINSVGLVSVQTILPVFGLEHTACISCEVCNDSSAT